MNNKNIKIQGTLVNTDEPIWKDLLNSPNIQELFDGIEQAEKDIQAGKEGQDFDIFFNNSNKDIQLETAKELLNAKN